MATSRYGTGSVYYRRDKKLWCASFEAGRDPNTGRRRRITVTSRQKTITLRKLEQARREYTQNTPTAGAIPTLKQICNQWLETRKTQIRPKTYAIEKAAIQQHIIPLLGNKKITQLTPQDLQTIATHAQQHGLSTATTARYQAVLQRILREAEKNGHPIPRPILVADKQKITPPSRASIPTQDALKLIQTARHAPGGAQWILAILQGLRQAEILGLRWENINYTSHTITIQYQLQPLPYLNPDQPSRGFRVPYGYETIHLTDAYHLVEPKSRTSKRTLPMLPWVEQALHQHQQNTPQNPWGLVFTTPNGSPMNVDAARRQWRKLQKQAGVSKPDGSFYVLHETRHTTATLLLAVGVEPEIIKNIMGHSEIVTQSIYQHVDLDMTRDALHKIQAYLDPHTGEHTNNKNHVNTKAHTL